MNYDCVCCVDRISHFDVLVQLCKLRECCVCGLYASASLVLSLTSMFSVRPQHRCITIARSAVDDPVSSVVK